MCTAFNELLHLKTTSLNSILWYQWRLSLLRKMTKIKTNQICHRNCYNWFYYLSICILRRENKDIPHSSITEGNCRILIPSILDEKNEKIKKMLQSNYTMPMEFLLVGFTDSLPLRVTLFLVFLMVHTLTLVGNMGLIILVNISSIFKPPCITFSATCLS